MMLRALLILALAAGGTHALTLLAPSIDTSNAIRAALEGDPLVKTSETGNRFPGSPGTGRPPLTVHIAVSPCPRTAKPACRGIRLRKAQALATLLSLAVGKEETSLQVNLRITLGKNSIAPGPAPTTANGTLMLLKRALGGNYYFKRVWDRSAPPIALPGLDSILIIFRPAIVQYKSNAYTQLDFLTTLPAAQLFESVFKLSSLSSYPRIQATSEPCAPNTFGCRAPI